MPRLSISGLAFLALGIALFVGAWGTVHLPARLIYLSAGGASAALGISYIFSRPEFLRKRADGRLTVSSRLLFWPYHLLSYTSLILFRLGRVEPFQEIVPGVYLGGWLFPWEQSKLAQLRITSVLDLTCEMGEPEFLRGVPSYLCVPLLDGTAPSAAQLRASIDFIRERLPHGPVYIHCAMGHGRSATVVAGYLLATGAARDLPAAIEAIRAKRPGIRVNAAQRKSLEVLKS